MADGASASWQYLESGVTCSLCLNYYKNPVVIKCGHSFCKDCIACHWVAPRGVFSCPQCGKKSIRKYALMNKQLAKVTEMAKQLNLEESKTAQHDLNAEDATRFCEGDQTDVHNAHDVIPAEEVSEEYKATLHKVLDLLKADIENISKWEDGVFGKINNWKLVVHNMEKLIEYSFGKMHQFLKEEKVSLMRRLRHENHKTLWKLEEILNTLDYKKSSVEQLITNLEAGTQPLDPELLMVTSTNSIFARRNDLRIRKPDDVDCVLKENYCIPGYLEMVRKYEVHVILDPETAHFDLIISEDAKHARRISYSERDLGFLGTLGHSERFRSFPAVLGTGRIVSGRHYWEIEYGKESCWELGVCLDSVNREEFVNINTHSGFWTILTQDRNDNCDHDLEVPLPRERIGIFVDYEAGEVTFYNVSKKIAIHNFSDAFSGVLRPFFGALLCCSDEWLTVCPVSSTVQGSYNQPCFPQNLRLVPT